MGLLRRIKDWLDSHNAWLSSLAAIVTVLAAVVGVVVWSLARGDNDGSDRAAASEPVPSDPTTTPFSTTSSSSSTPTVPPTTPEGVDGGDESTTSSTSTTVSTTTSSTSTTTSTTIPAPPTTEAIQFEYLSDLDPVERALNAFDTGSEQLAGEQYDYSVLLDPPDDDLGWADYQLGRQYACLTATVGVQEEALGGARFSVQVRDPDLGGPPGELASEEVVLGGEPWMLEVSVQEVFRVRLQLTQLDERAGQRGRQYVVFGDANASSEPCPES